MSEKRTDSHRKGAIIPAEYEHALSYNLATTEDGWPVPSFGVNCELDRRIIDKKTGLTTKQGEHSPDGRCCIVGLTHVAKIKWASHGNAGKCTACGTRFVYGEVWRHIPTGEYIHVGHICGNKYGLMIDRSAFELEAGRHRAAAAAQIQRKQNAEDREAFLAEHPGLAEALELEHPILQDMGGRFQTYRNLTDKQVALAMKLADEVRNPKPAEQHSPAPSGKQTFKGKVVSTKAVDGYYGTSIKMAVKVQNCTGVWIAWGTAPAKLLHDTVNHGGLKGCEVEVTATLTVSNDKEHFAFMKRPRGKLIAFPSEHNPSECGGCILEKTHAE